MVFKATLSALGELFLSKLGERTADNALNYLESITDFEPIAKTLEKNLKSLSAKASDVEEQIKNAELSGHKKRKREVEEWLRKVKSIDAKVQELGTQAEGIITRLMDGGKAAELNQQVESLVEESHNFGELLLDVCETKGVWLITTGMVGRAFEQNLGRIWSLLETGDVRSIGIYGMGGSGKTRLAKQINNRLVEESEGGVFWVTVSQDISIKSLQDKIAHSVGAKNLLDGNDEVVIRAAKLYKFLSKEKKNSVLILDDVWENIDLLEVGCPFSKESCRMIITTRMLDVCRKNGCEEVIAVQKLDEDEAWKLFSETLGKEIKLSPEAEEIAKSVAKLCGGLPLGIIVLGGSMKGEKEIYKWRDTFVQLEESIAGQNGMGEGDKVFKVLKYSFDRLNKHDEGQINEDFNVFQLCFLYCSLYPEDYEIGRAKLVGKLISEGLLDQRKSRRGQFDQGYCILDKLVNVCLLESCVNYFDNECVKMHDLVRGMALQIGGGKYMVRAGNYSSKEIPKDEEWTENLEKVSLMCNGIMRIGEGASPPNCPNLSTLLLHYCSYLEFIPDSFFTKMQGLCTLDLSETGIKMLPNSVSELKSLKALLLENCEMLESVPYLGNLKALRELNLDGTAIEEVPQGVDELLNLKFLSIDATGLEMLPQGLLLNLGCLQCVRLPYHLQVAIEEVENLKQLEVFWGRVKNVPDFNSFIRSRVHDTSYAIKVGSFDEEAYYEELEGEYFLGNFNKKVGSLTECSLNDEKVLGQDIKWLTISQCEGLSNCFLDAFSPSNYPRSLKKLNICGCGGIECIVRSEQELASHFSSLRHLELSWLDNLKGVRILKAAAGEIGPQAVFSSLKRLKISSCYKMRKLGLPVLGFPNLEAISIEFCYEMEEIFEDEGRGSGVGLPRLRELSLSFLPSLKSVCKATIICNSIQEISIKECPRLMKKLPLHLDVPPPRSLGRIKVEREWWESLEWDNPNLPTVLQPLVLFYPSLEVPEIDEETEKTEDVVGSVEGDEEMESATLN